MAKRAGDGAPIPTWVWMGVGFVVVSFAGLWALTGAAPMAGHSMTPPDTSAIAEGDPIVEVALPTSFSDQEVLGRNAFDGLCAQCHGANAGGRNGIAPPLVHVIYEPSHHGDEAFWIATQQGVRAHHWRFGNMPAIEGLTRADVKNIVAYIRALQRENGIL